MAGYLTRTKEGGSVASFIVVGVILVAVVIGGIYIVQKRGQNTQVAGPVSSSPAVPASGAPATTSPKPSSTSVPTPPPPSTKPPGVTTTPPPVTSAPKVTPVPSGQPMPKTGPSDDLTRVVMLGVLVAVAVAYAKSRSQLRNA